MGRVEHRDGCCANDVTLQGGRIVAVGTTAVRTLEWGATGAQGLDPYDVTAPVEAHRRLHRRCGPHPARLAASAPWMRSSPTSTCPACSLMLVSAPVAQAHLDDVDAGRRILLETYEVRQTRGLPLLSASATPC
ncbi:MAG: hypothetical protein R2854_07110 [Caldilineaceae bacterium]